jgi:hypothetical protein
MGIYSKYRPTGWNSFCVAPRTIQDDKMETHSSPSTATSIADLKVVEFCLERFDSAVRQLEILVETIALRDQLHSNVNCQYVSRFGTLTCCSHCLNRDSSALTCSVNRLRSCSSSSWNLGLLNFLTLRSPYLRVSICCWR